MGKRILVVDDDPHIREVIEFALQKADYEIVSARDGAEALSLFEKSAPDFIVLDVGLPEIDGLEVCRRIRTTSQVPILFLSARDEEIDRIIGLEIGGDDYVVKPFSPRELVARVKVILKRVQENNQFPVDGDVLIHGIIAMDLGRRSVKLLDKEIVLTGTEFDILRVLLRRPGVVFSREQILDLAWADNIHVSDRTIDSHVRNLRGKLREGGCEDAIRTVHGVGFQLDACKGPDFK